MAFNRQSKENAYFRRTSHTRPILTDQTPDELSLMSPPETSGGPDPESSWCWKRNSRHVYHVDRVSPGRHLLPPCPDPGPSCHSQSAPSHRNNSRTIFFRLCKTTPEISAVFLLPSRAWRLRFYLIEAPESRPQRHSGQIDHVAQRCYVRFDSPVQRVHVAQRDLGKMFKWLLLLLWLFWRVFWCCCISNLIWTLWLIFRFKLLLVQFMRLFWS